MSKIDDLKQEIKQEIERLQGELFEAETEALEDGLDKLFKKYPRLINFSTKQLTPYFCDGETPVFYVERDEPDINGYNEYDKDEDNSLENLFTADDKEAEEIVETVRDFINQFDDEFFEQSWGDHIKVIFTREGIETEQYTDHD